MKPSADDLLVKLSRPLALVLAVGACGGEERAGTGLALTVAPLALPGVDNVCYTIVVTNQAGDVVARAPKICADRYGTGGAISYVMPCDADTSGLPPGDDVNDNTVTLILEDLFTWDSGAFVIDQASYTNPCGLPASHPLATDGAVNYDGFGPCQRTAPCRANSDTRVDFSVTIARDAHVGFFDIAVAFEDVMCSAKLDCIEDPPGFLLDPATRQPGPSATIQLACTSGSDAFGEATPTWLYLSDVVLACDGEPALAPTVLDLANATQNGNQGAAPGVYQWQQTGQDITLSRNLDMCSWGVVLGLDLETLAGRTCTLEAWGAASDEQWPDLIPPASGIRPVIHWIGTVVRPDGHLCTNQALDGPDSTVRTVYTSGTISVDGSVPPPKYTARRQCGGETAGMVACEGLAGSTVEAATVDRDGRSVPAVNITVGGTSVSYPLPPGTDVVPSGCCLDSCCRAP